MYDESYCMVRQYWLVYGVLFQENLSDLKLFKLIFIGRESILQLHEVDVLSPDEVLTVHEKSADVIVLLYDMTNPDSFAYCASIYLVSMICS